MEKNRVRELTLAALVGSLYAVLSYFGGALGLTFGAVQLRFSEALCVLPFLFPATAPGLFVGCVITNLMSTVGPLDIIFGSLATLAAALLTANMPHRFLAPLPPVVCNGLVVGGLLTWYEVGFGPAFWPVFLANSLSVAAGEVLSCGVLGGMLLSYLPTIPGLREAIPPERLKYL